MSSYLRKRTTCRLCNSGEVVKVVNLEPIPLSENYCDNTEAGKSAERFPVDLYMCKTCGHVQHMDIIDSEKLWANYSYFSSMSHGMIDHFRDVSQNVIKKFNINPNSLVVDIGSNDGSLLQQFKSAGMQVLGIDPAVDVAKKAIDEGIPTKIGLMSCELAESLKQEYGKAKVITAFNVFAHADDLGAMVDAVCNLLDDDGIFVFEAQYLQDIVDKKLIATIFHEHMSHHSVKPLIPFFEKHGMELISVEHATIQHGSLIGVAQKKHGRYSKDNSINQFVDQETKNKLDQLETFFDFDSYIVAQRKSVQGFISREKKRGRKFAGFGAARSGPTLLSQLGIKDVLDFIVDDHPQKVGKFTAGDGIYIYPTTKLDEIMPDYTFILAWVHVDKIVENNQDYLRNGGKFIVLSPQVSVITIDGMQDIEGEES